MHGGSWEVVRLLPAGLGLLFTVHAQRDASPTGTLGSLARKLPPGLELVGGQMGVVAGTQASSASGAPSERR